MLYTKKIIYKNFFLFFTFQFYSILTDYVLFSFSDLLYFLNFTVYNETSSKKELKILQARGTEFMFLHYTAVRRCDR